jgi:hypothetical protein
LCVGFLSGQCRRIRFLRFGGSSSDALGGAGNEEHAQRKDEKTSHLARWVMDFPVHLVLP